MMSKGLYANIHAKRKRIKAGSKEKMRKPGAAGAPRRKPSGRLRRPPRKNKLADPSLLPYASRPAQAGLFLGVQNFFRCVRV